MFPVYDWNMPLVVRDFIKQLDVSNVKYIFAAVTCNYLPGQSLESMKKELKAKGKMLNAGFVVRMPGTYLPLYGANSLGTQRRKFAAMHAKTNTIAKTVFAGNDRKIDKSPLLFDRLLAPKMEKHMEAFPRMDCGFTVGQECNGCGTCTKVCPFDNIAMSDNRPVWLHRCQQCYACIHLCTKGCIQIGDKTQGKTRYKNPNIALKDLIASATQDRQETAAVK